MSIHKSLKKNPRGFRNRARSVLTRQERLQILENCGWPMSESSVFGLPKVRVAAGRPKS